MRVVAAIGCLMLLGEPVFAQVPSRETGSIMSVPRQAVVPDGPGLTDAERARIALSRFADCTVTRSPRRIGEAFAMIEVMAQQTAIQGLVERECLRDGVLRMSSSALRLALFAALVRSRENGFTRLPRIAPIDLGPRGPATDRAVSPQLNFGACVVSADAALARAVVIAPSTSERQDDAIQAITPVLATCLPSGAPLALSKSLIEGALAEALYRGVATTGPEAAQ